MRLLGARVGRVALVLGLLGAGLATPATAASQNQMLAGTSGTPEVRAFSARRSDVDVTVRFQGGSVQCPSGPCTYVGVTHYTFRKRGPLALASAFFPQPGRPGMFLAYVQGRGHTSDEVDVLSSRGDAIAVCHDAVAHQFDGLGGELHRRRSLVTLHPFGSLISLGAPSGVPLDSRCGLPLDPLPRTARLRSR